MVRESRHRGRGRSGMGRCRYWQKQRLFNVRFGIGVQEFARYDGRLAVKSRHFGFSPVLLLCMIVRQKWRFEYIGGTI